MLFSIPPLKLASSMSPPLSRTHTLPFAPRKTTTGDLAAEARHSARTPLADVRSVTVPAAVPPFVTVHFDSVAVLNNGAPVAMTGVTLATASVSTARIGLIGFL